DREETRFEPKRADRFQQVDLSVDVRRERLRRSLPRGAHEALRREVDHVRWLDGIDELSDRGEIPQIGFDERDTRSKVLDRLRLASPAARSEHECALTERVFGHVAADETRDAGDEKPHRRYYTGRSGDQTSICPVDLVRRESGSAIASQHNGDRAQKNPKIEAERPTVDVRHVQPHPSFEIDGIAPADLPEPGDPRPHGEAPPLRSLDPACFVDWQ